jgi:hypothetical protein
VRTYSKNNQSKKELATGSSNRAGLPRKHEAVQTPVPQRKKVTYIKLTSEKLAEDNKINKAVPIVFGLNWVILNSAFGS